MTEGDPKKLGALLRKLRAAAGGAAPAPPGVLPDTPDGFDDLLHQLVFSLLMWETTTTQARAALRRLREHFADLNEVRVCMADDTAEVLGERYPLARERSLRLRYALHDIFTRQQVLSLAHLRTLTRREALSYLESLEGLPPYVAQRVAVVSLDAHACPADDRLSDMLARARVVKPGTLAAEVSRFLTHHTGAEESLANYLLLQHWVDAKSDAAPGKRASRKAPPEDSGKGASTARATAKNASARAKPAARAKSPRP